MSGRMYTNLPVGATHLGVNGVFYKAYSAGWLYWDTYHESWRHSEAIVQIELI